MTENLMQYAADGSPLADFRWFVPAGKPDHTMPKLQRLWVMWTPDSDAEEYEWRDVPTVYEGAEE